MQISYKPVVQACHEFKILKEEQMNFKFLFNIQFSLVR